MARMTRPKLLALALATLGCSAVLTAGVAAAGDRDGAEQTTLRITTTEENLAPNVRPAQQPSQTPAPGDRDCPKGERDDGATQAQPAPSEGDV
jgi:hypothetical protein